MSKKLLKPKSKVSKIPPNSNEKVIAHYQDHYSGSIPQPSDLQKYENIKIGFAERIITMAENEANHR